MALNGHGVNLTPGIKTHNTVPFRLFLHCSILHFSNTSAVMSHESNAHAMSASVAVSWFWVLWNMRTRVWSQACYTDTEKAFVLCDITGESVGKMKHEYKCTSETFIHSHFIWPTCMTYFMWHVPLRYSTLSLVTYTTCILMIFSNLFIINIINIAVTGVCGQCMTLFVIRNGTCVARESWSYNDPLVE